jgi:hypothetical protein
MSSSVETRIAECEKCHRAKIVMVRKALESFRTWHFSMTSEYQMAQKLKYCLQLARYKVQHRLESVSLTVMEEMAFSDNAVKATKCSLQKEMNHNAHKRARTRTVAPTAISSRSPRLQCLPRPNRKAVRVSISPWFDRSFVSKVDTVFDWSCVPSDQDRYLCCSDMRATVWAQSTAPSDVQALQSSAPTCLRTPLPLLTTGTVEGRTKIGNPADSFDFADYVNDSPTFEGSILAQESKESRAE